MNMKRERACNFDKAEIQLLTELVCKHSNVIENKKTDSVTNKEKEASWAKIAAVFNAASSSATQRSSKTLKLKYESMKKNTKKKLSLQRQQFYKTGGGSSTAPDLSDNEEKIVAICSNISGLEARNDSDNFADGGKTAGAYRQPSCSQEDILITFEEGDNNDKFTDMENVESNLIIYCNTENQNLDLNEASTKEILPNSILTDTSRNEENLSEDSHNRWSGWTPQALKKKPASALTLKANSNLPPRKSNVTRKIDQLTTARLELVELQKNHAIAKHNLEMLHLENEERRKEELHVLRVEAMKNKATK